MKFRKKPVIVDAVQWFPEVNDERVLFPAFHVTGILPDDSYSANHHGCLPTPDGDRVWKGYSWQPNIMDMPHERYFEVESGDWIIADSKGHISVLKPDIFEQTYEKVEE